MAKAKRVARKDQFGKLVRWARKQVHNFEQTTGIVVTDTQRQRFALAIASVYLDGANDAAKILSA